MSKQEILEQVLIDEGKLSNVNALNGYPTRTNRLSAFIYNLRNKYEISTERLMSDDGDYVDCIYHYKGRL